MIKKGTLFVISGPSGVGKGTLVGMLRAKHPEIKLSVSATTRKPRPGEVEGIHYFYLSKEDFKSKILAGEFLEWAEFSGNYYGTNKQFVQEMLNEGQNLILEIDVQGALQVKDRLPEAVLIFIEPPSVDALKTRLFKRSTEEEDEIERRLAIVKTELDKKNLFRHVIVNDDLDTAYINIESTILKEISG